MLDELGIVGVSWRQIGSEALAGYSLAHDSRDARLASFARSHGLAEIAYLETCNRVEVLFADAVGAPARDLRPAAFELLTGSPPEPGEADRSLRAWQGEGACEHLFLVAAGLDSAAVGEVEIAGQVRLAHERARASGLCGARLTLLFEEAGRIAAAVRSETGLGEGSVSLAEVAVGHVRRRLARTPGAVALIGVSAMTERAALSLAKDDVPLIMVNRTVDKALELADRFGGGHSSLSAFCREPKPVEALLCATGSAEAVLDAGAVGRIVGASKSGEPPLAIDMAVPADIDAEACTEHGLQRVGMDAIVREAEANRSARLLAAADARARVDEALPRVRDRVVDRVYGPMFGTLQELYRETAREGVERLWRTLGDGNVDREKMDAWGESLAKRMAHLPTVGLKGLMRYGPEGSLDAFLRGLDPERRDLLRGVVAGGSRVAQDTGDDTEA